MAAMARKLKFEHLIKTKSDEKEKSSVNVHELDSLKERIALGRKLTSVAQTRLEKSSLELSLNRISPWSTFLQLLHSISQRSKTWKQLLQIYYYWINMSKL